MSRIDDDLDVHLEDVEQSLSKSTFRGRRVIVRLLKEALRAAGVERVSDLEGPAMARFIAAIRTQITNGDWGASRSTTAQNYTQMMTVLRDIGVSEKRLGRLKRSRTNTLNAGPTERSDAEGFTDEEFNAVLELARGLVQRKDFVVKGAKVTKRKRMMAQLYLLIAATYGLRQASILDLRVEDFTRDQLTYRIQKGAQKGVRVTRPMTDEIWTAMQAYLTECGSPPSRPFNDASWLGAAARTVMLEAGLEPVHNRLGIHKFRHTLANWGMRNNIPIEAISSTLNHSSTRITEQMYVGQSTRDLVAGELIERYGQEMLQAGDRMVALEEDMLALMEDLAPFLEHGQATFHDETMDLHWFDDGFNENGSGPVVPTPGLEPGTP